VSANPRPFATASIKSAGKSPASKPRTSAGESPAKARVAAVSKVPKPRSQTSAVNPLIAQDLKDLERAKKLFHEAQKIYENLTKKHMATLNKPQTKPAPRPVRK
jgi:predicted lipid-binding transport protein (Tim44 family)